MNADAPIDLQEGPQRAAAETDADIIFFGGAKGGGKSRWLLHEAAKWYDLPGHTTTLFRRTYPELRDEGGLWDESLKFYPLLGAEPVESRMRWKFPSGKIVSLRHLQRVADAYAWNGKNLGDIGFDELHFFEEEQFWILLSCQRSIVGGYEARPRVRATMNPDPDSWVLKFVEWYIDEAGYPIPERSGVIRWFGRKDGSLVWFASKEDAHNAGVKHPKSFTFIPSKVTDNKILLAERPEYMANLEALPPVEQARYLGGNWRVRPVAGDYFRETWFPVRGNGLLAHKVYGHPTDDDIVERFRIWDLASTPWKGDTVLPGTSARDDGDPPDWTRGGLFGVTRDHRLILLDMKGWRDSPGAIESAMIVTARTDGPGVTVVLPHDPAQAGDYQVEALTNALRREAGVRRIETVRATKGKEEYAAVASRYAFRGKILVQRAPWNRSFFSEIEAFPGIPGKPPPKKDQVDVLSQACVHYWGDGTGDLRGIELAVTPTPGVRALDVNLSTIGGRRLPL